MKLYEVDILVKIPIIGDDNNIIGYHKYYPIEMTKEDINKLLELLLTFDNRSKLYEAINSLKDLTINEPKEEAVLFVADVLINFCNSLASYINSIKVDDKVDKQIKELLNDIFNTANLIILEKE